MEAKLKQLHSSHFDASLISLRRLTPGVEIFSVVNYVGKLKRQRRRGEKIPETFSCLNL